MRSSIEEYRAVEEAAMMFVESVAEGDGSYAKELFTEDAVLFGFLYGKMERGSIEQLYRNVDSVDGGESFKVRADVVDVWRPWRSSASWNRTGAAGSTSPTNSS